MTGYDSKYTGPSWQGIMANGLDGGDIQRPIDDPIAMDVIMTRDYCGNYTYHNYPAKVYGMTFASHNIHFTATENKLEIIQ